MHRQRVRQTGFSAIVIILVVVVVGAIAATGMLFYQRQRSSSSRSAATTTTQPATQQKGSGSTQTEPTPTTQGNLFQIPELGIELTVPDSIKDLKYAVDTTSVPGTTVISLTTATLQAQDGPGSQCTATQAALGAMWKLDRDPVAAGASARTSKKVGDTYLLYSGPQQGCSNKPSTYQLQSSQAKLLEEAVQTAQAL